MNWLLALRKLPTFKEKFNCRTPHFSLPQKEQSVLSLLSDRLYKTQVGHTLSAQECVKSLTNFSQCNKALLSNALRATPQTEMLLSKYSQGIFNKESLAPFSP